MTWRPTHYWGERLVPLLVRFPRPLLDRIDAEVKRRQGALDRENRYWHQKIRRAEVIRDLVEKQLGQVGSGQHRK